MWNFGFQQFHVVNSPFSVKIFYRNHTSISQKHRPAETVEYHDIALSKKNWFQFQFNNHIWEQPKLEKLWYYTKLNCRSFSRHHVKFMLHEKKNCSTRINLRTKSVKDLIFVIGPKSFVVKRCKLEPHNWNSIDVKLECLYLLLSTL